MARGWGRSEEDLAADKEQAGARTGGGRGRISGAEQLARRRTIELSLARIRDELARTPPAHEGRVRALEAARADLSQQLAELGGAGAPDS
jgi:hypothetical protein